MLIAIEGLPGIFQSNVIEGLKQELKSEHIKDIFTFKVYRDYICYGPNYFALTNSDDMDEPYEGKMLLEDDDLTFHRAITNALYEAICFDFIRPYEYEKSTIVIADAFIKTIEAVEGGKFLPLYAPDLTIFIDYDTVNTFIEKNPDSQLFKKGNDLYKCEKNIKEKFIANMDCQNFKKVTIKGDDTPYKAITEILNHIKLNNIEINKGMSRVREIPSHFMDILK